MRKSYEISQEEYHLILERRAIESAWEALQKLSEPHQRTIYQRLGTYLGEDY